MTIRDELVRVLGAVDYVHADDMRWLLRTHGPALVEALDAKRAIEEQAAVTECVSVTGRDPSDVIKDIIGWHAAIHLFAILNRGGK